MTAAPYVVLDTETTLISAAEYVPRLVCLSMCGPTGGAALVTDSLNELPADLHIVGHNIAFDLAVLIRSAPNPRRMLASVFEAYSAGRIHDTKIRQQLIDIAAGEYRGRKRTLPDGKTIRESWAYSLEDCMRRIGVRSKKEGFRLFYGLFEGVPQSRWVEHATRIVAAARECTPHENLDRWPAYLAREALARIAEVLGPKQLWSRAGIAGLADANPSEVLTYPCQDVLDTRALYEMQQRQETLLGDEAAQCRAAWWMHLSTATGAMTDARAVDYVAARVREDIEDIRNMLVDAGMLRSNGTRDTAAAMRRMYHACVDAGVDPPRTESWQPRDFSAELPGVSGPDYSCIALDAQSCENVDDPILQAYSEFASLQKTLSNDLVLLRDAAVVPAHPQYGMAATGRSTCARPNIQNLRRLPGIRECFVPRSPGGYLVSVDYPQLELYTLAQCCMSLVGRSTLRDALLSGEDPHLSLAASMMGLEYVEAVSRYASGDRDVAQRRQLAKAANFGFPGGMGVSTFLASQRAGMSRQKFESLGLDVETATELRDGWFARWSEMKDYFSVVNANRQRIRAVGVPRIRGQCTFCQSANTPFQGLGADIAKRAGWYISEAIYLDKSSALYGCSILAFVHDEFVVEVYDPNLKPGDVSRAIEDCMHRAAIELLPDVPMQREKLEGVAMRRWSKNAKRLVDASGDLMVWDRQIEELMR